MIRRNDPVVDPAIVPMLLVLHFYFSIFLVRSPAIIYRGQTPTRLVKMNIPDTMSRMIPAVPVITFVKYNTAIVTAIRILITLSAVPMFLFIIV